MHHWKWSVRSQLARPAFIAVTAAILLMLPAFARGALRELSTDRPDATESPFTVDAGHWQIETDLVSHTRNRLDGTRTREWDFAPFNLRFGISDNFEAGVFVSPFTRITEEPRGGPRSTLSGFGDITARAKFNFSGNNGDGPAFGLITDLNLPAAASGLGDSHLGGSVIFPFATELPGGWEFGAMTGMDFHHRDGGGMRGTWINTATAGHALCRNVSGYVELTSAAGEGAHVATFNFGFAWKLDANTQFDAGANLGISRTADDLQLFTGVSRRF